jgi:TonB-linked SusC/RagA family outer membrane protein
MKFKLLHKILMLTKLSIKGLLVQCLLINMIYASDISAQSIKSVKESFVTLNLNNASLYELFRSIESQTSYSFTFSREDINRSYRISMNDSNINIGSLLLEISKETNLIFKQVNNNISVSKISGGQRGVRQEVEVIIQTRNISGRITSSEDGDGLPGVNVIEKGTNNGTVTDVQGRYSLTVSEGAIIVFSSVGFTTEEVNVGSRSVIDLAMVPDIHQLQELVVIGALGLKRQEKALSYATQTVSSDDLIKTRDLNFLNSLSGQAAGVEIKKSSSGPGGSTQVVLRGVKSLDGASTPLFVIDGIPMTNRRGSQPNFWGGVDAGDGMSQLNPDDIESITILRGANAAALYGSQGSNGVIVITTKKGKEGATKVNINTGATYENIMLLPEMQYKYGSDDGKLESWSYTPGNYDDSFIKDFFQTGQNLQNSITVSGGTSRTTVYFSYANVNATGVVPTNYYQKNNLSFRQSTNLFNDNLTVSSNLMLTAEKAHNRNPAGYRNLLPGLYSFPRNLDFNQYKDYAVHNANRNMPWPNWHTTENENPYWYLHKRPLMDDTKRLIGNVAINYALGQKMTFQVRGNYDAALKTRERQNHAGSRITEVHDNGAWEYSRYTDEMSYMDGIITYDESFGPFRLNTVFGVSNQESVYGNGLSVGTGTNGLTYPNQFSFQNIPDHITVWSNYSGRLIKQGIFANTTLGFKEMLYLDLSGRNDWASSLAGTGNVSYFYPMIGLTAILNEMVQMPAIIDLAKVRASHSTVAHEVPFNRIFPQHGITGAGGVDRNTVKPFTNLKPEMVHSFEVGTDWRFFSGRLGMDFTYYKITSKDQFIQLPAPAGSGYTSYYVNAGEIVNEGVEVTLNATPVEINKFKWNSAVNYANNNNKVVELHPELTSPVSLGMEEGYESKFVAGGSIGDLYVYQFLRDDQGRIMLDPGNGTPLRTATTELIGNLNPEWSLGWNNNLTYGNIAVSFLINSKVGGKAVSQTEAMLDGQGFSKRTGDDRDRGYVIVNAVREGVPVTEVDPYLWYRTVGERNGIKEAHVYDRTNIRLSQLALSYNFNMSALNLPLESATLSFVGQNLFFIYKKAPFDPELALSTSGRNQSLDNYNIPSTRTLGFNLNVTF